MEKVAHKVSQILKRPSQEEFPESTLPPFKPLPKIQLHRESSLPRIEVDRPITPSSPKTSLNSRPMSPYPQYQTLQYAKGSNVQDYESNRGQKIPPNAKKLRVRSFLWVKPTTSGLDSALYNQVGYRIFSWGEHIVVVAVATCLCYHSKKQSIIASVVLEGQLYVSSWQG